MGKALYRTYRSKSFDEILGQEHVTTTLKNSLKKGSISHAYLLTGPRGVGKTSVARLLAFGVNKLDYTEDVQHLDIIEIDAASNRRIEEIRSLRDTVNISPVSATYKVYIVDEVHMLTKEAFNALLKTLEEPPAHVIFILATTEVGKLPETIVSRCVRFSFKPIQAEQIQKHLADIAKKEKLSIDDDALRLISEHSGGSVRDAISLLDQVKNVNDSVTIIDVERMMGLASDDIISGLLLSIANGDLRRLSETLTNAKVFGVSDIILASQIGQAIRNGLLSPNQSVLTTEQALNVLSSLLDVPSAYMPSAKLELALFGACIENTSDKNPKPQNPAHVQDKNEKSNESQVPVDSIQEHHTVTKPKTAKREQTRDKLSANNEIWEQVLNQLKAKHNTLYGVARMASAECTSTTLRMAFRFPFHYKKMDDAKSKEIMRLVLHDLGYAHIEIEVALDTSVAPPRISQKKHQAENESTAEISTITNIFGAPEMLES